MQKTGPIKIRYQDRIKIKKVYVKRYQRKRTKRRDRIERNGKPPTSGTLVTRMKALQNPITRDQLIDVIGFESFKTLTDTEKSVLMVLSNLATVPYPMDLKLQLAGIEPDTWYKVLKSDNFATAFSEYAQNLCKVMAAQVDLSIMYYAINGSAPMAKVYKEYIQGIAPPRKSATAKKAGPTGDAPDLSDEARDAITQATRQGRRESDGQNIPGVSIERERIEPGHIDEVGQ